MKSVIRNMLCVAMLAVVYAARAQAFPNRPIDLIVTSTPGSQSDTLMRFIGAEVSKTLGQAFVILNKPSVAGTIGADQARRATPDGYTIFMGGNTTMAANVYMVKKLQYDPLRDFVPITLITTNPLVLVVRSTLPIKSVSGLVDYAKKHPGQLNYGVGNAGNKVAVKLLESLTGMSATEISYKGATPAMQDLIAGRLDFIMADPLVADPYIRQGIIRALAVTAPAHLPSLDTLPPMDKEIPGYGQIVTFLGFYAPKGTPKNVIETLNKAVAKVINSDKGKAHLARMGMVGKTTTPEELASFTKEQVALWGHLTKISNIQPQ